MNIDKILTDLLSVEGGYSNHKNDTGGETMWGVTIAVARANGYSGPMKDLTKAQALEIYRQQYFFKPGYDKVLGAGFGALAAELFDTGVNMGPGVASRFLQQSLNALNNQGNLYADIGVDGVIGNATINALKSLAAKRGEEETEDVLLKCLNCLQGARYISLAESRPANEAFVWGWIANRVGMPS